MKNKACAVCGSSDIHNRPYRDEYDCSTCKSVVTGLGESMKYRQPNPVPEYSVAAEQRRQLGLIATLGDRLDKLNRKVDDLLHMRTEDPMFPQVLAQNFRKAQAQWAIHGHAQEFCVYGNDGFQYSVRVSR